MSFRTKVCQTFVAKNLPKFNDPDHCLREKWLIDMYNHPDSIITFAKKRIITKVFWDGIIPKDSIDILFYISKYNSTDSTFLDAQWEKEYSIAKTSISLILAIITVIFCLFLLGFALRKKISEKMWKKYLIVASIALTISALALVIREDSHIILVLLWITAAASGVISLFSTFIDRNKEHIIKLLLISELSILMGIYTVTSSWRFLVIAIITSIISFLIGWKVMPKQKVVQNN